MSASGSEMIEGFKRKKRLSGRVAVSADWLVIALACFLYARAPSFVAGLLAALVIGRQQQALAVLGHEAVHGGLHPQRALNDFIGQWLCLSPLLISLRSYRYVHLQHHRAPLSEQDPDIRLTGGYPVSARTLARRLFRDATGRTTLKFIRSFNAPVPASILETMPSPLLSYYVMNALLCGVFLACGRPLDFLLLWIAPQFFVLPVLLRLRGIVEHAGLAHDQDQSKSTRTVTMLWYRLVFAPHNVGYHIEHHLHPQVGFAQLPALHHARMRSADARPAMTPTEVLAQIIKPSR